MKHILIVAMLILFVACVPMSIAPNIKDDTLMVAKKFKKKLPNKYAYIFEDPKDAYEFYNFINIKYELNHVDVESNVPFNIDGETLYFSFFEVEKTTKILNLIPIVIDAKLESKDVDPFLSDLHTTRKGKWYLILTVTDEAFNDCLNTNHPKYNQTLKYLKQMKKEYLITTNYYDALMRKK